jgi:hypothetical protein
LTGGRNLSSRFTRSKWVAIARLPPSRIIPATEKIESSRCMFRLFTFIDLAGGAA